MEGELIDSCMEIFSAILAFFKVLEMITTSEDGLARVKFHDDDSPLPKRIFAFTCAQPNGSSSDSRRLLRCP